MDCARSSVCMERDAEAKPCLARPCSYTASPELLYTDLCNRVSPGLHTGCASPCACAVCRSSAVYAALHGDVSQDVKNQHERCMKERKKWHHGIITAPQVNKHADKHVAVVDNQHPSPMRSYGGTHQHRKTIGYASRRQSRT